MSADLKDLMGHIDYFFENVSSTYDTTVEYEVFLKDKLWKITNKTTNSVFETKEHEDALGYLIKQNADLLTLHSMIFSCICTEGTLRRMQLKKCEDLVGIDAIDKSDESWSGFAESLGAMIAKEFGEKEETVQLEIVE